MFETEIVLWLQSFASECLTVLMVTVSEVGYTRVYIALALIVTFGIDFRIGFVLFQMMLWTGALTSVLKILVALPRPAHVDSAVQLLAQDTANSTPFRGEGGDHFLDLPEARVIEHYRLQPDISFGLPSGHVGLTTTFWSGLAVLLKSRLLMILAPTVVLTMALSRMYLGYHFLADVVAGAAVGLFVMIGVRRVLRPHLIQRLFRVQAAPHAHDPWRLGAIVILAGLPLTLLALGTSLNLGAVGRLAGANLAFALLAWGGIPSARPGRDRRAARVGLAVLLYAIANVGIGRVLDAWSLHGVALAEFLSGALPPFLFLAGTVHLGVFLHLYERKGEAAR